jgi:F-type H+-transporting ATPase subunit epsilon
VPSPKKLKLKVATPERVLFEEEVSELVVPTTSGVLTILPEHAALISEIAPGEMIIRNGKDDQIALVFGGFLHVKTDSEVIVLAESAEHIHEITEKEAEEARKRAEGLMKSAGKDKVMMAEAEAMFAKNLLRLRVLRKHRTHKKY